MTPAPRPRRSALFLPASNPRAIAKARACAADVVILDLEDAVAPALKVAARAAAVEAVGSFGSRELVIRVNALDTPWAADDLAAVAAARPDAVLLPKVADVATLAAARAALGSATPLWAMIETCTAVLALPTLAAGGGAHGLTTLVIGVNDLASDMRCTPGRDRAPLWGAMSAVVTAARAHGLIALDGVLNAVDDPERLVTEAAQGRAFGFDGKSLIHPDQITATNAAFAPSAAELAWARGTIAAFADPAETRGAIRLDGGMVERLHLVEAQRIVAAAGG